MKKTPELSSSDFPLILLSGAREGEERRKRCGDIIKNDNGNNNNNGSNGEDDNGE